MEMNIFRGRNDWKLWAFEVSIVGNLFHYTADIFKEKEENQSGCNDISVQPLEGWSLQVLLAIYYQTCGEQIKP